MDHSINLDKKALEAFCARWHVSELALFGSVLGQDFTASSDIDVLITFNSTARPTLFAMVRMQCELERLMGRRVDLVSRRGIELSSNRAMKDAILGTAEVVYAS
jgi:uncharacterized protein